jgi:hypothetical protein
VRLLLFLKVNFWQGPQEPKEEKSAWLIIVINTTI